MERKKQIVLEKAGYVSAAENTPPKQPLKKKNHVVSQYSTRATRVSGWGQKTKTETWRKKPFKNNLCRKWSTRKNHNNNPAAHPPIISTEPGCSQQQTPQNTFQKLKKKQQKISLSWTSSYLKLKSCAAHIAFTKCMPTKANSLKTSRRRRAKNKKKTKTIKKMKNKKSKTRFKVR